MIRILQTAIGVEWRNGMKLYVQFMIILVFSFLGEAISTIFHLPIPGSIIVPIAAPLPNPPNVLFLRLSPPPISSLDISL